MLRETRICTIDFLNPCIEVGLKRTLNEHLTSSLYSGVLVSAHVLCAFCSVMLAVRWKNRLLLLCDCCRDQWMICCWVLHLCVCVWEFLFFSGSRVENDHSFCYRNVLDNMVFVKKMLKKYTLFLWWQASMSALRFTCFPEGSQSWALSWDWEARILLRGCSRGRTTSEQASTWAGMPTLKMRTAKLLWWQEGTSCEEKMSALRTGGWGAASLLSAASWGGDVQREMPVLPPSSVSAWAPFKRTSCIWEYGTRSGKYYLADKSCFHTQKPSGAAAYWDLSPACSWAVGNCRKEEPVAGRLWGPRARTPLLQGHVVHRKSQIPAEWEGGH